MKDPRELAIAFMRHEVVGLNSQLTAYGQLMYDMAVRMFSAEQSARTLAKTLREYKEQFGPGINLVENWEEDDRVQEACTQALLEYSRLNLDEADPDGGWK